MSARQEILARGLLPDDASSDSSPLPSEEVRQRMQAALVDCERQGLAVSVLFVEVVRLDRRALQLGVRPADVRSAVVELLRRDAHDGDLYAREEGAGILVLLTNSAPEATDRTCRQTVEHAKQLVVTGVPHAVRAGLAIGLAHGRGNGALHFETLALVAREGAAVARQRGGECFVHTMLYDVMQRRAGQPASGSAGRAPEPRRKVEATPPDEPIRPASPVPEASSPTPPDQEELEILRRRVAKLKRALEERDRLVAELAALKGVVPGIASIYREVQGLAEADPDRERKGELLQAIYAANLELLRLRRSGVPSAAL